MRRSCRDRRSPRFQWWRSTRLSSSFSADLITNNSQALELGLKSYGHDHTNTQHYSRFWGQVVWGSNWGRREVTSLCVRVCTKWKRHPTSSVNLYFATQWLTCISHLLTAASTVNGTIKKICACSCKPKIVTHRQRQEWQNTVYFIKI